jgi:hypothetical protein
MLDLDLENNNSLNNEKDNTIRNQDIQNRDEIA